MLIMCNVNFFFLCWSFQSVINANCTINTCHRDMTMSFLAHYVFMSSRTIYFANTISALWLRLPSPSSIYGHGQASPKTQIERKRKRESSFFPEHNRSDWKDKRDAFAPNLVTKPRHRSYYHDRVPGLLLTYLLRVSE